MRSSTNNRRSRKMCQREYESVHLLKHAKNKLGVISRATMSSDHEVEGQRRDKGGRKSFHCIPFLKSS